MEPRSPWITCKSTVTYYPRYTLSAPPRGPSLKKKKKKTLNHGDHVKPACRPDDVTRRRPMGASVYVRGSSEYLSLGAQPRPAAAAAAPLSGSGGERPAGAGGGAAVAPRGGPRGLPWAAASPLAGPVPSLGHCAVLARD